MQTSAAPLQTPPDLAVETKNSTLVSDTVFAETMPDEPIKNAIDTGKVKPDPQAYCTQVYFATLGFKDKPAESNTYAGLSLGPIPVSKTDSA